MDAFSWKTNMKIILYVHTRIRNAINSSVIVVLTMRYEWIFFLFFSKIAFGLLLGGGGFLISSVKLSSSFFPGSENEHFFLYFCFFSFLWSEMVPKAQMSFFFCHQNVREFCVNNKAKYISGEFNLASSCFLFVLFDKIYDCVLSTIHMKSFILQFYYQRTKEEERENKKRDVHKKISIKMECEFYHSLFEMDRIFLCIHIARTLRSICVSMSITSNKYNKAFRLQM